VRPLAEIETDCARVNAELDTRSRPRAAKIAARQAERNRWLQARHARPMSSTTRRPGPPIAVDDIPPACGQLAAFRRPDGRVIVRRQPCDWKACPTCGPRLRQRWADQWAHAMGKVGIWRLVVGDGDPAKLRRRKAMAKHEAGHIPLPGGQRAFYTTVALAGATPVVDVAAALSRDFAAMPNNDKRRFLSAGWRQVVADAEREQALAREPWEYLGLVARSLEHVELAARDQGVLVGRTGDVLVVEAMPPAELGRFLHRIRCKGPWQLWGEAKRKQAA
jgi:hypothetical protein